jgi:hypothetical protein
VRFVLLACLGLFLADFSTPAASLSPHLSERRLRLYHTHTGERIDIIYKRGDVYIP